MNKPVIAGGVVALVVAAGGWWFLGREAPPPPVEPDPAPPAVAEAPAVRNPVPDAGDAGPLPALDDSDSALLEALAALVGQPAVQQYLIPKDLIRKIVATIDNLPRRQLAIQLRPVVQTPGELVVTPSGERFTLGPANAARYAPFMRVVQAADARAVAGVYLRFYPLFQQAYEALGYPGQYFNDRLVEVIDHLLATPDLAGPIELSRPSVMYVFTDPALESLSAGQKTLVRMGAENAAVVKGKLLEIKAAVAAAPR